MLKIGKKLKGEIFFGREDEPDAKYIQLECGHCFEYRDLDKWMGLDTQTNDNVLTIAFKQCPRCRTTIWPRGRYGNLGKICMKNIDMVKKKVLGDSDQLKEELNSLKQKIFDIPELYNFKISRQLEDARHTLPGIAMMVNKINFL